MQPDPYSPPSSTVIVGQPSTIPVVMQNQLGQVVYVQQRGTGAQIIGVLVIIWGLLLALGGVISLFGGEMLANLADDGSDAPKEYYLMSGGVGIISGLATILAGFWLYNYQRRGVSLAWLVIGISFLINTALSTMIDYDSSADLNSRTMMMLTAVCGGICSGLCGLIVAIPIMSSNHGLDSSRLFG
ncbi:MAG: hypothetical protein QF440_06625 [Candidatus Thalassarchaeaceae archaeon]|nr:hypothetical protein [Candidatus Thalassarchaeaceae archaeon]